MERKRFRVGSIAALFAVVAICVAIFSTLTVLTAASDYRVARRYGEHVRDLYTCESLGQQWLAQADGYLAGKCDLPEGSWRDGSELGTRIVSGGLELTIRLNTAGDTYEISQWSTVAQWEPDQSWELLK